MRNLNRSGFSFMERLEDRVLFDAVPDGSFIVPSENADTPQIVFEQTETLQQADHLPRELILIDAGVQGSHELLRSILATNTEQTYEVRYVDNASNGIDQVSAILAAQTDNPYSAIHIISHGEAGRVQLGNSFLDASSIGTHAADIAQWGNSLTADADLLFYGCDLAADDAGKTLTSSLAHLTGADVAASDDITGNAQLGGNWELEHRTGSIETASFKVQSWSGSLAFAIDDINTIQADDTGSATGNVLNNDFHSGGTVTEVHAYASQVGAPFQLNYGTITLNANGSYAYDVNENHPAVIGLRAGEVLEEILSYEVTDTNSDTGVLVIRIVGVEDTLDAANDLDEVTTVVDPVATGNVITDTGSGFDIYDRGLSQLIWENEYSSGASVNGTSRTIDGITVGIATSDPDGAGSFGNQTVSYGTNGGHSGYLRHSLSGGINPASEVTTNFSFSSEVYSLSFILADIDRDQTAPISWQDQFSVVGSLGGVPVNFSALVAGTITESPSGTFYGDGSVPPSEAHGNVNIVFDGAVDSVTITYKYGPSLTTTPSGILGAVSDLTWQPPINVFVSSVDGSPANVGTPFVGQYGTFFIASDGSYTYTVDDSNPDVIALGSGESLQDTVQYTLENTIGQTSTAVVTMTVNGINEVPQLDIDASGAGTGFSTSFTEGAGPINVADTDVLISDADNPDTGMASLTITPGSISDGSAEILTFNGDLGSSISFSLDAAAPTQQITVNGVVFNVAFNGTQFSVTNSAGGDAPNADFQSLIAGITYNNTSPTPTSGSRTLGFVVNDGETNSNLATSSIAVNTSAESAEWSLSGSTNVDEGGTATYSLSLNNPLRAGETAQINIALNGITASSNDYATLTSAINAAISSNSGPGGFSWNGTTLTFTSDGSGVMTPLAINLGINDDGFLEGSEDFTISISSPASTTGENITVNASSDSVTTTIADTQGPAGPTEGPSLWSISGPVTSDEGSNAQYTVSLSGTFGAGEAASVNIGLIDIDTSSTDYADFVAAVSAAALATPGVTFNSGSGTVTFTSPSDGAAMPSLVIDLAISDDAFLEGPEDFRIQLTNAVSSTGVNVALGTNTTVSTTINDTQGDGGPVEGPGQWSISGPTSRDEGATAQYTISLSGSFGAGEVAQVEVSFADLTASSSDHADFIAALAAAASAAPNVSFNSTSGILTYTAPSEGASMPNLTIDFAITDDALIEGPENYSIGLSNSGSTTGANVGIGTGSVTTTINDTQGIGGSVDGPGQWSISGPASVNEGGNAQYTVSLNGSFGAGETATVDLSLSAIETNSTDYSSLIAAINTAVALDPNLSFNSGSGTLTYTAPSEGATMANLVIDLGIATDGITEGDEDFALVLTNPNSSTGANVSLDSGNSTATTTIIDSDVPNWSISGPVQSDEGATAQFTIALSGTFGNGVQISVDINLSEISTNGSDYGNVFNAIATAASANPNLSFNTTTGTLTFTSPSGGASMNDMVVDLQINDDSIIEGPEDFSLSLTNPSSTGVSVGITNASVTTRINDTQGVGGSNDGPGLWNLSGPVAANEGATAQYVVSLSGTFGGGEVVTVDINYSDISTNSSDHGDIVAAITAAAASNPNVSFNSTTGQLTYTSPSDGASMSDLTVDVAIVDDSFIENDESFSISLSNAGSSTSASFGINNASVSTTINDTQGNTGTLDGPGEWSITGPTSSDEGATAQYVVSLTGEYGIGETASVDIALSNIDTSSSDYGNLISAINAAVSTNPSVTFNSTTGTLTFVASSDGATMTNLQIDLPIVDDLLVEGAEDFSIGLSNAASTSGANVALSTLDFAATTTINDTQGVGGSLEQSIWAINGNTSVDEGGTAAYTISLSNNLQAGETAQVQLSLSDLETTNSDYSSFATAVQNAVSSRSDLSFNSTTGILTFTSPGTPMTDLVINLVSNDDSFVEGMERFRVALASPGSSTGSSIAVDTLQDDVTTTIRDTVGVGGVNEEVIWAFGADQTVAEGGNATYTLSLGNGVLQNGEQVSLNIGLVDIDTDASDYLSFTTAVTNAVAAYAGPGTLSFNATTGTLTFLSDGNAMSALTIDLGTFDDLVAEGPEDFRIQITNPTSSTGANVSIDSAADDSVTTIDDRIGAGTDQVTWNITGDSSVDEGGTATYQVGLVGLLANGETTSVELNFSDLTTNASDYSDFVTAIQTAVSSRPDLAFNSTTNILTFTGDGNAMANLVIGVNASDDTFVEGPESFSIGLSNPASLTGALAGLDSLNSSVTTTIVDTIGDGGANESADWSITGSASVNEGSSIGYNLSLAGLLQSGETATVQLTLNDIETNSSDYQSFIAAVQAAVTAYAGPGALSFNSTTGILTFTSDGNAMSDLAISLGTTNDTLSEGNERLTFVLSNPGSSTGAATTITSNSSVTTTVVDNDVSQWSISGPTQGDEGESVQYQVSLSGTFGAGGQSTVDIDLSDISTNSADHSDFVTALSTAASANPDVSFNSTTNTLTFTSTADGSSMTPLLISLDLANDASIEGTESFSVGISNPTATSGINVQLNPAATQVQTEIQDTQGAGGIADGPGEWSISGPISSNEGATAQYTITLGGQYGSGEIVTVNIALTDIGTNSSDYGDIVAAITSAAASNPDVSFNSATGTLTFQSPGDGATMADLVINLPIVDDAFAEGPEDFSISLSSANSTTGANVQIGTGATTTTIDDRIGVGSDQVIWAINGDSSVDEGGTASYTVSLFGLLAIGETTGIELGLSNISTNSADYSNFVTAVQNAVSSRPDLSFNSTTNVLTFVGDGAAMTDLVISLLATDDTFVEGPEALTIGLSNEGSTTGVLVAIDSLNSSVTTTISDTIGDGGAIETADWAISGPTNVNEGSAINYVVSLAGTLQAGEIATIQLTLSDIETASSDYQSFATAVQNAVSAYSGPGSLAFNATTGILTFTSDGNAMSDLNISLATTNDALSEGNERLTVAISNPGSTTGVATSTTAGTSVTTTIIDDDISQWSISGPIQADEGETVQYQIGLSGSFPNGAQSAVVINLNDITTTSADHSDFVAAVAISAAANPNVSFNSATNTLTYTSPADGSTMTPLVVSLSLSNDTFIEGSENFLISLSGPTATSGITVQLDPTANQVQTQIQDTQGVGGAIDGPGEWSISGPVTINEGTTAQFTISLNGQFGAGQIITVDVALADIGTNNSDYGDIIAAITSAATTNPDVSFNSTTGTLTFLAPSDGASMADLVVDLPIVDDAFAEGPEDFTLALSGASSTTGASVQIATASATTTIDDRTGAGSDQVTWAITGDTSVDEGGTASYTISLAGVLAGSETTSVELALSNISTDSADYSNFITAVQNAVSSRTDLAFNAGTNVLTFTGDGNAMADLNVNLGVTDDSFVEGAESFSIGLSNQTSATGAHADIDVGNDTVTTTISDTLGDGGATESADWSISGPANVTEGSPINYVVTLAGTLQNGEIATIQLSLSDLETNSSDYSNFATSVQNAVSSYAGPGSLSFNSTTGILTFTSDGNAMNDLSISLPTTNDSISEGNERLTLSLSNDASLTGAETSITPVGSITTTIVDNDVSQWSISGPTQGDEGESVQYQIALSGSFGAGGQSSVVIELTDITTSGGDHSSFVAALNVAVAGNPDVSFNSTTNTLTFTSAADGSVMTPLLVSLDLVNDSSIEGSETFDIRLSSPAATSGITVQLDPTANQVQTEIRDTQGVGGTADGPGEWSISGPTTVNEGATAQYVISLSGQFGAGETVTVNLGLSDIGTNSSDYGDFLASVSAAAASNPDVTFNTTTGILTFQSPSDGASMTNLVFDLPIVDDVFAEGPESFAITLSGATSSTGANVQIATSTASTTIDDRTGVGSDQVAWSIRGDSSVDEGGVAFYTIGLAGILANGESTSVQLDLSDVSTNGADYADFLTAVQNAVASRVDLSFNSGTNLLTFTGDGTAMADLVVSLNAIDDTVVEGAESFSVRLSNQASATGASVEIDALNNSVTTTIDDTVGDSGPNESADWSIAAPASVNEGSPIIYDVSLAGTLQSGETATIQLTLSDIETSSSDYQSFATAVQDAVTAYTGPGRLAFNPTTGILTFTSDGNSMSDLSISLGTNNDSLSEGNERLSVAISNPGSSTGIVSTIAGSSSVTTTILDDDLSQWSISGPLLGDEGETVQYQVSLSGTFPSGAQSSVVIDFNDFSTNSSDHSDFVAAITAAAAANSNVSYNSTTNTLTYTSPADGSAMTPLAISLDLTNDSIIEGSENFSIALSNPTATSGITVQLDPTANQVQTEIQDTQGSAGALDGPAEWSISGPTTTNEASNLQYVISLSGQFGAGEIVTVNVALADIGTSNSDYGDIIAAFASAAAANPDVTYNSTTGLIAFQSPSDGASMADLVIDLPIVDDSFAEGPENFSINLSGANSTTGANVQIATATVTTTIDDRSGAGSDQVTWSISGDSTVDEGGTASYTISLAGVLANGETTSVQLSLSNISTDNADYSSFITAVQNAVSSRADLTFNSISGLLTYTGDGTAMTDLAININATDDTFVEGPESFSIQLASPVSATGASVGLDSLNNSVTTTIADTQGDAGASESVEWSISGPAIVNEGSPINYAVALAGVLQSGETTSIQLNLNDVETSSSDYQDFVTAVQTAVASYGGAGSFVFNPTSGILTFVSDGNAMGGLNISLGSIDDTISEGNERLSLSLSNPASATGALTTAGNSTVITTIVDDDVSQWSILGATFGDEGETVQYQISLSGSFSSGTQSSVVIGLNDISSNSSDYGNLIAAISSAASTDPNLSFNSTTRTLTFTSPADGSAMTPLVIALDLANDALIEGSESFSIALSNPTATSGIAVQLDPTATQVQTEIRDTQGVSGIADGPGEWSISGPANTNEGSTAQYTISLNGQFGAGESVTVDIALTDIDTDSSDYGDILAAIASAASANPDVTFNPTTGTLTFLSPSDGATMADLVVDLPNNNDLIAEGPEEFTLSLSSAGSSTGANLAIATGAVTTTIQDAQILEWAVLGTTNVAEGSYATYVITLDGVAQAGEIASVNLGITNLATTSADYGDFVTAIQDAIAGRSDLSFNTSTGTLTFTSDGNPMRDLSFSVQAVSDGIPESSEDFRVQLTSPSSSTGASTVITTGNSIVTTTITTRESGAGNALPIATDDIAFTFVDTSVAGNLLTNDGSPNGSVIFIDTNPATGPSHGSVVISPDGSFTYLPNTGFVGIDSFVYEIRDAAGQSDTATVIIRVSADPNGSANNKPQINDDGGIGQKNQPIHGNLLANDSEPIGDSLTINTTAVTPPVNGSLVIQSDGTYIYTPNDDFVGTDSFVYEACDSFGNCETAVVHLTVFDGPPVAQDDINHTAADLPVTGNVLTNDRDPNQNDSISVNTTPVVGPSNGTLSLAADGSYTYTPNSGFTGTDTFTYEVCDEAGNCDTGQVTIEVRETGATNSPPVANSDSTVVFQNGSVNGQLLSNDGDANGDAIVLRTAPVSNPANGSVIIRNDGTYTYTPNSGFIGTDSFEYEICEEQGACDTAVVTIQVVANINGSVNDAPHGGSDSVIGQKNVPFTGNLIANDTDPNGDPLTINTTPIAPPSNGNLSINSDGTFTYVPDAGFTGNDSFQYEVCDDQGACTVVTAVVTIFNEPPVAVDDQYNVISDSVMGRVTENDSEPNGDPISATLVVRPQHGTITWQPDGTFTYTPGSTYTGNDSFVYIICDDSGACSTASVQLTSPFAFDSFTNQATDENAFEDSFFEANNRNRELLLSQRIGSLAPEPILAGYATPGSVLIGRIYNAHGALIAEATTHASPAGNWVMHFFDAEVRSHYVVMIEHVATEEVAVGNHHFRLTPTTYRSLQLGTNHTDSATIGTILSDTPSTSLDIWHQQNVSPLRLQSGFDD